MKGFVLCAALWLLVSLVQAEPLQVKIVGAPTHEMPIVLGPLAVPGVVPAVLDTAIRDNLTDSGLFRVLPSPEAQPCDPLPAQASVWRSAAAVAFFSGQWSADTIKTCLWDIPSSRLLTSEVWPWTTGDSHSVALLADAISDHIYERLTGLGPYFLSRILYVRQHGLYDYAIQSTNVTGQQVHTIYASQYPILSPAWDDSGKVLLFVSFFSGKPVLEMIDFARHTKETVAQFQGTNSAGVFSHDGRFIAMVLTKDGHAQIYEMSRQTKELKRLMVTDSMDTEPVYGPRDAALYFTSNREGSPQIYALIRRTGVVKRVTFQYAGAYSPAVSHDGQWLAYVAKTEAGFVIAVQSLKTGDAHVISTGPNDLHPTFAPNDAMIAFSAQDANGQRVLSVSSRDGSFHYLVRLPDQKIRQPFWGPLVQS